MFSRIALVIIASGLCAASEQPKNDKPANPNDPPPGAWINNGRPIGAQVDAAPFSWKTDVGASEAEQRKFIQRIAVPVMGTTQFFKQIYGLKPSCFEDYVKEHQGTNWEPLIRINIWKRHTDFLKDFQQRYETKTIPGAVFGRIPEKDGYAKPTGKWVREIGCSAENADDAELLRHLYHEMGHLFVFIFMGVNVEVPSWIEEGNAELFQYRVGNGTKPEEERFERQGWLREMLEEGSLIPWSEFTKVRNIDNLDFTWKDPARSTIQYAQAWSVVEFMINNPQRQAAYIKMLHDFRKKARAALESGQIRDRDQADKFLYGIQEKVFKDCYGIEIGAVEDIWKKEWVTKEFENTAKKNPVVRYHRGNWLLSYRIKHEGQEKAEQERLVNLAEERFKECVQLAPKCPEGHVGMGQVAQRRGDNEAAQGHFARALELNPKCYDAQLQGGRALVEGGRAEEAVPLLEKAVAQRPTAAIPYYWLGKALAVAGEDPVRAVEVLAHARDLRRDLVLECAMIEGAAWFTVGDYEKAYTGFLEAHYAQPGHQALAFYAALAQAWNNDQQGCLRFLEKVPASKATAELKNRIEKKLPLPVIMWDKEGDPSIDWQAEKHVPKVPKPKVEEPKKKKK